MPELIAKKFILKGKVQGVGCRIQVQEIVENVGHLAGWVKNREDGTVEVVLKGPPLRMEAAEKIFRDQMIPPVKVDHVIVETFDSEVSIAGFLIKR